MTTMELIAQIFEICLFPLLAVLTTYFVSWIKTKSEELKAKTEKDNYDKYFDMLTDTITTCCIATTQTYVEALKAEGKFDEEAQKVALQKTYNSIMTVLSVKAKEFLTESMGDFEAYVYQKIEENIYLSK